MDLSTANSSNFSFLRQGRLAVFAVIALCFAAVGFAEEPRLKAGDVVAFVGGGDVAARQQQGYLETLLTIEFRDVRFRNFGWEGDTVFAQPRDYNFPPLTEHLRKHGATVIVVQYGRMEVFEENGVEQFRAAYERMLDDFARVTPRLVLVTPIPFERGSEPLPDASQKNNDLAQIAKTIRQVGDKRKLPVIDVFSALVEANTRMTDDGLNLTADGHFIAARVFAKEWGIGASTLKHAESLEKATSEGLRRLIVEKNKLWFHYWRPQNWAFLGGDRISQPSSRDHIDPQVRWFPAEIEKFEGLIAAMEKEIKVAAGELRN